MSYRVYISSQSDILRSVDGAPYEPYDAPIDVATDAEISARRAEGGSTFTINVGREPADVLGYNGDSIGYNGDRIGWEI